MNENNTTLTQQEEPQEQQTLLRRTEKHAASEPRALAPAELAVVAGGPQITNEN